MTRGVIYQLCGAAYAELLAVSLWSLRKHFAGPVCLFTTDPESWAVGGKLALDERLGPMTVKQADLPQVRRHGKYCIKPILALRSPFDATVMLDADTLVLGSIDPLFEHRLTITDFSGWESTGRRISGRIRQWQGLSPWIDLMVETMLQRARPAINTGVVAWQAEARRDLQLWANLTLFGHRCSFTDEIAMQILMSEIEHELVDDRWNCSAHLGVHRDNPVIRHFHGRSHVRKEGCRKLWWPHFEEAIREKAGGIDEWAGQHDQGVAGFLAKSA